MFRVVRTRTKSGKPTLNLSELLENEWVDRSKEKIADTQKEIIRLLGMDSLTFKASSTRHSRSCLISTTMESFVGSCPLREHRSGNFI